jgi:hypothetical protein
MLSLEDGLEQLAPSVDVDTAILAFKKHRSRKRFSRIASRTVALTVLVGIGIGGIAWIGGQRDPAPMVRTDPPPTTAPSTTADPLASDPDFARLYSSPGESAKDLAERISSDVLGDYAVTFGVDTPSDTVRLVTMESNTGSTIVATISLQPDGRFRFDGLASPGLSTTGFSQVVSVPESGVLTIIGYDGGLTMPGEVMYDRLPVTGPGDTDRLDLAESSWLRIDLAIPDGRVLRYLGPR